MTSQSAATTGDRDRCPHDCGYVFPIPACVRLHLIQHHDYGYEEALAAFPDQSRTSAPAAPLSGGVS